MELVLIRGLPGSGKYDALKKKPEHAVFLFRAEESRNMRLARNVQGSRVFGHRVCTHWLELPPLPKEPA